MERSLRQVRTRFNFKAVNNMACDSANHAGDKVEFIMPILEFASIPGLYAGRTASRPPRCRLQSQLIYMNLVLVRPISSQHPRLIFYVLTMNIGQAIGRNCSYVRGIGARITRSYPILNAGWRRISWRMACVLALFFTAIITPCSKPIGCVIYLVRAASHHHLTHSSIPSQALRRHGSSSRTSCINFPMRMRTVDAECWGTHTQGWLCGSNSQPAVSPARLQLFIESNLLDANAGCEHVIARADSPLKRRKCRCWKCQL